MTEPPGVIGPEYVIGPLHITGPPLQAGYRTTRHTKAIGLSILSPRILSDLEHALLSDSCSHDMQEMGYRTQLSFLFS